MYPAIEHQASTGAGQVTLAFPADLRRRLDLYISQCDYEISGLGTVESRNGILVVSGLYLLDQQVTEGSTNLSSLAVAKFLAEAPQLGVDVNKVRLWWHSHAKFDTYWSTADEEAIDSFKSAPWFVSVVGNHAGQYLTRVDLFPTPTIPFRLSQKAELTTVYVREELKSVREEISKRVHRAEPTTVIGRRTRARTRITALQPASSG